MNSISFSSCFPISFSRRAADKARRVVGAGICLAASVALFSSCQEKASAEPEAAQKPSTSPAVDKKEDNSPASNETAAPAAALQKVTLAGGCFWCTEAVMEKLVGVTDVVSGYTGGHVDDPSYEQVCEKTTGHAEAIEFSFDPSKITFEEILEVFFHTHDPTTLNQQGNDKGPQYRSAIFFHTPAQKAAAENLIRKLNTSGEFSSPIVTEVTAASKFWPAEEYHQDFFARNPYHPYCQAMIPPKLEKLKKLR
ncbi:MAG: peptide-methionine (S)-S-oxide reductase MsrA [Akkermansiaceae bacterium]|nr:peptide-methionine (S)-S-oxide reductase MsrA [Akkermansiaceae bacterium]MCP5551148.1 peptide-methionine (S)-S-oxide reductase MsrA [Akkermansiaceae bacterium]